MRILESAPALCNTNASLRGFTIAVSDHIEINCSVKYSGLWTPVFVCADGLPGDTSNESSSNPVRYRRVIAASDIEHLTVLNCSMDFTPNNIVMTSEVPVELQKPISHFVWNTPEIRIVNTSGKCNWKPRCPTVLPHSRL